MKTFLDTNPSFAKTFSHLDITISDDIPELLKARIIEWRDNFADVFGSTDIPPVNTKFEEIVGPHHMPGELKENARPQHAPRQFYKRHEKDFITMYCDHLIAKGVMIPNPTSQWAARLVVVDKPVSIIPRVVVDWRSVNRQLLKRNGTMPDGVKQLQRASVASKFGLTLTDSTRTHNTVSQVNRTT